MPEGGYSVQCIYAQCRPLGGSACNRWNVEADGDAVKIGAGRGIAAHDERVVAGDDMCGRIGQAVQKIETFEHFGDVVNDGKGTALFEIIVEVCSVG